MMTSVALLLALHTPAPANCNRDATVTAQVAPDFPDKARGVVVGPATVFISVSISPQGKIARLRVFKSSGNGDLDQAAIHAAQQSTYSPRVRNCKPASGNYLFKVTFDPAH
ncbi:MAG TPA: energy transducer TonB [Candidatus Rubrimentiphilum sp.]|nr:energy transducer TonB [Candidatus Rubrimentiphilum sp.]